MKLQQVKITKSVSILFIIIMNDQN
jgi:hypothetical protein